MTQPDGTDIGGRIEATKLVADNFAHTAPVTKGVSYVMTAADSFVIFSAAATTATLPPVATAVVGKSYTVKNGAGSGVVTVAGATGTVNGAANITLAAGVSARFVTDGTNWFSF